MSWFWILQMFVVTLRLLNVVPPHWRYLSPRKQRSMKMALLAARASGDTVEWSRCWLHSSNADKSFVMLGLRLEFARWRSAHVYVVWPDDDQIDDLGYWTFYRYGLVFPSDAVDAYEECRDAGLPWPVGQLQWLQFTNEKTRPGWQSRWKAAKQAGIRAGLIDDVSDRAEA